jgi:hypothetical protein
VDEARQVTVDIDQARELASNTAYQLRDKIDTHVFANITGTDGFTTFGADAGLVGGTAHRSVSATTANIINLFANAKRLLLTNNVEQMGDWCAVIGPKYGAILDIKAASSGFNTADATLKNGYSGDFMGFQVYVSNNLPTGVCSTIAPTVSGGVSSGTCKSIYFGRKNMINLYLQPPRTIVRPCEDKIGTNYITYAVYGSGVTTKNRSRGLNVGAHAATA